MDTHGSSSGVPNRLSGPFLTFLMQLGTLEMGLCMLWWEDLAGISTWLLSELQQTSRKKHPFKIHRFFHTYTPSCYIYFNQDLHFVAWKQVPNCLSKLVLNVVTKLRHHRVVLLSFSVFLYFIYLTCLIHPVSPRHTELYHQQLVFFAKVPRFWTFLTLSSELFFICSLQYFDSFSLWLPPPAIKRQWSMKPLTLLD